MQFAIILLHGNISIMPIFPVWSDLDVVRLVQSRLDVGCFVREQIGCSFWRESRLDDIDSFGRIDKMVVY